jgi:molybdenum cofactor biosynthesis protein MoaC
MGIDRIRTSPLSSTFYTQTPFINSFRPFSSSAAASTTPSLTHIDQHGRATMVDVADKPLTKRTATAVGRIYIPLVAYELVTAIYPSSDSHPEPANEEDRAKARAYRKGDTLAVAQLAAIMASKKTADLIPLCHPLNLTNVTVTLTPEAPEQPSGRHSIACRATVSSEGKTGVEMEALTAVSVGLLTVWDMLKAVAGKEMEMGGILVSHKAGGRSGDFRRSTDPP